ncbi:MAG: DUF4867 family protein [Butyrivibrio sp.]|nr:DUF4867 family protein [Butyrivibrio sp.]
MKIYNVTDPEFKEYGKVIDGIDVTEILDALENSTPLPEGTDYVPEEPAIQNTATAKKIAPTLFGGLPVEFGWCNGHNTKLNCLEYHRNSEFNLGTQDFILLLAKQSEIDENFHINSDVIKAFKVPKGVMVEVYATSLHYAPCHVDASKGFKVLVALPKGTNTDKPEFEAANKEDTLLRANNKWLIAHKDASEAQDGAFVGIDGVNIDLA